MKKKIKTLYKNMTKTAVPVLLINSHWPQTTMLPTSKGWLNRTCNASKSQIRSTHPTLSNDLGAIYFLSGNNFRHFWMDNRQSAFLHQLSHKTERKGQWGRKCLVLHGRFFQFSPSSIATDLAALSPSTLDVSFGTACPLLSEHKCQQMVQSEFRDTDFDIEQQW